MRRVCVVALLLLAVVLCANTAAATAAAPYLAAQRGGRKISRSRREKSAAATTAAAAASSAFTGFPPPSRNARPEVWDELNVLFCRLMSHMTLPTILVSPTSHAVDASTQVRLTQVAGHNHIDVIQDIMDYIAAHDLSFRDTPEGAFLQARCTEMPEQDAHYHIPAVRFAFDFYIAARDFEARGLVLELLRRGANPNALAPGVYFKAPMLYQVITQMPSDIELQKALVDAGHTVTAAYFEGGVHARGVSYLHGLTVPSEVNLIKKLLAVGDSVQRTLTTLRCLKCDRQRRNESFILGEYGYSVEAAFQRLAQAPKILVASRNDWQGDFYEVEFKGYNSSSQTFRNLASEWDANIERDIHQWMCPQDVATDQTCDQDADSFRYTERLDTTTLYTGRSILRQRSMQIHEEVLTSVVANLLQAPSGWDHTETALIQPTHTLWNVLHWVANSNYPTVGELIINDHLAQIEAAEKTRKDQLVVALCRALAGTEYFLDRTPAHMAAATHPGDLGRRIYDLFTETERRLDCKGRRVRDVFARVMVQSYDARDKFGFTPSDYASQPNRPLPHDHNIRDSPDHKPLMVNTLRKGEALSYEKYKQGAALAESSTNNLPLSDDHQSARGMGGWDSFGKRDDLELDTRNNACAEDSNTACAQGPPAPSVSPTGVTVFPPLSVAVYDHLPNASTVLALMTAHTPILVRGGAKLLSIDLAEWKADAFLRSYGAQHVQVSTIPYLKSFQSYIASQSKFGAESYAGAPQSAIDDAGEQVMNLYPPQTCPEASASADKVDNVTLDSFIQAFWSVNEMRNSVLENNSKRRANKQYIFSQVFSQDNPSLMRIAGPVYEWVMSNIGIQSLFETQFYLGPPGSGAPMHWHGTAINLLAFGKKRWQICPAELGTAYSVVPSEAHFGSIHEFRQRNESSAWVGGGVDPACIELVQESGDMILLPKEIGHSTINIESSIGFAFEMQYYGYDPIRFSAENFEGYLETVSSRGIEHPNLAQGYAGTVDSQGQHQPSPKDVMQLQYPAFLEELRRRPRPAGTMKLYRS